MGCNFDALLSLRFVLLPDLPASAPARGIPIRRRSLAVRAANFLHAASLLNRHVRPAPVGSAFADWPLGERIGHWRQSKRAEPRVRKVPREDTRNQLKTVVQFLGSISKGPVSNDK